MSDSLLVGEVLLGELEALVDLAFDDLWRVNGRVGIMLLRPSLGNQGTRMARLDSFGGK